MSIWLSTYSWSHFLEIFVGNLPFASWVTTILTLSLNSTPPCFIKSIKPCEQSFPRWKRLELCWDRVPLASILGISNEENRVTIDSNRKSVQEVLDWIYEVTTNCLQIHPCPRDRRCILHGGDFPDLLPRVLAYFSSHTLIQNRGG